LACAVGFIALPHLAPRLEAATQSSDYIAEHLPEIAMDNRYASLPLWTGLEEGRTQPWHLGLQGAYSRTQAGTLHLDGPMLSLAVTRQVGQEWQWSAFAFLDAYHLSSGTEGRMLEVSFASSVPLDLPARAEFSGLSGSGRHLGLGVAAQWRGDLRQWGRYAWTAGVLWQRFALRDYALDFRVLDGASAGATGHIDYSATYSFVTPFAGLAWPRERGSWASTPHLQIALPLPRRGVVGRITGANFDVSGDTATYGRGTHFGDPSLTLGWDFTYRPLGLTVDVGTVLSQALVERAFHKGMSRNLVLSLRWNR
jgi:hypothetical protein